MSPRKSAFKKIALLFAVSMIAANAHAALKSISDSPLVTGVSTSVQPNVFLMMDDSGSMGWEYMPDTVNSFSGKYGGASEQCNGVYYDPSFTYDPPVDSTGASYPNSSFTSAWRDGYNTGSGTTDLSTSFSSNGFSAQAAFYYRYSGTQTTEALRNYYNTGSTFYRECNSSIGSAPGNAVFTKVTVSATSGPGSTDERTNFANWYSYYRDRLNMMKTSTGLAFKPIGSNYRVGFATMNNNGGSKFLNLATFNATQKAAWYNMLYSVTANNSTPLLGALSDVGLMYAHKLPSNQLNGVAASDPIQYSCQQNFTILSTDGFWNSQNGNSNLSGTSVGQQDGTEIRPMYDGASQTSQTTTTTVTVERKQSAQPTTATTPWTRTFTTVSATQNCSTGGATGGCLQDNGKNSKGSTRTWCMEQDNTNGRDCKSFGSGSPRAWACRGSNNSTNLPGGTPDAGCVNDGNGQQWCLYNGNTTTDTTSCEVVYSESNSNGSTSAGCVVDSNGNTWCMYANNSTTGTSSCNKPGGSNAYACKSGGTLGIGCKSDGSNTWCVFTLDTGNNCNTLATGAYVCKQGTAVNSLYVCKPPAAINGYTVTTQNQAYNQLVSGTTTTVTDYTTTTTTTVQTINGQAQPAQTSTSGPTSSQVSQSTAVASDSGAPGAGTSWTNSGGATTACMASPPAAGASTPAAGTTTTTNNGSATVTTLSGPTTTTPNPYNGQANPRTTTSSSGGTTNTLADVAEYYYITDLRTSTLGNNLSSATGFVGTDVATNNVPTGGLDSASWQHMTTFTLGLGARGSMVYSSTYQTDTSGDYFSVKNGLQANSGSGICTWQANGTTCNWPAPPTNGGDQTTIDDLWHAAVNGRGQYFSATNPGSLATSLSTALSGVSARTGASAAATTSNPNVTSGDNFVFSSTFVTVDWTGELIRQQLDLTTGATLSTVDWSAQAALDANSTRTIYTYNAAATNGLMSFTYANLSATQKTYFDEPAISSLSQLCTGGVTCLPVWQASTPYLAGEEYRHGTTWYHVNTAYTSGAAFGATDTTNASVITGAAGTNLVNYLRGDRTNEGLLGDTTKYFRQRQHILGDIVNAEAVYVKTPLYSFSQPGYTAYASSKASRQGMVYAAANDGMLHAFYSSTGMMDTATGLIATSAGAGIVNVTGGGEAWTYVPTQVLPNLYKLADKNYSTNHKYFVDGTPIAGDVCTSNCTDAATAVWKTILVGGLNAGGRGYYALDITNPAAPKALWEFTDTNLGLSFGNPQIARLKDGTWVVMVTSGYNNVSPGDGGGHLFVLNAYTGSLIRTISTGVGDTTTPSGLSKIIAQVVNAGTDDTVLQVYGGDLLGNVWRFDVNGDVGAAGYDAQLLVTLHSASPASSANTQPITTKPQVGISGSTTMVFVGTGSYLSTSDLADTSVQTLYGINDPLSTSTTPSVAVYSADPHATGSGFTRQTQTTTTCPAGTPTTICLSGQVVRTSTRNAVGANGWYVDLPDSGERASTDPTLKLGTLGFTTNVPSTSACTVGGYSYTYFLDYRTGAPVSSSTTDVLSVKLGNALATRPVYVRLPNNTVVQLIRLSDGTTMTTNVPIGSGAAATRRVSRRELNN